MPLYSCGLSHPSPFYARGAWAYCPWPWRRVRRFLKCLSTDSSGELAAAFDQTAFAQAQRQIEPLPLIIAIQLYPRVREGSSRPSRFDQCRNRLDMKVLLAAAELSEILPEIKGGPSCG